MIFLFLNPKAFKVPICVLCFFTNLFIVVTTDKIAINRNKNVNTFEYVSPSSISEL